MSDSEQAKAAVIFAIFHLKLKYSNHRNHDGEHRLHNSKVQFKYKRWIETEWLKP